MKRAYAVVVGVGIDLFLLGRENETLCGNLAAAGFQPGDEVEIRPRERLPARSMRDLLREAVAQKEADEQRIATMTPEQRAQDIEEWSARLAPQMVEDGCAIDRALSGEPRAAPVAPSSPPSGQEVEGKPAKRSRCDKDIRYFDGDVRACELPSGHRERCDPNPPPAGQEVPSARAAIEFAQRPTSGFPVATHRCSECRTGWHFLPDGAGVHRTRLEAGRHDCLGAETVEPVNPGKPQGPQALPVMVLDETGGVDLMASLKKALADKQQSPAALPGEVVCRWLALGHGMQPHQQNEVCKDPRPAHPPAARTEEPITDLMGALKEALSKKGACPLGDTLTDCEEFHLGQHPEPVSAAPDLGYLIGSMTESFDLLCRAEAETTGKPLNEVASVRRRDLQPEYRKRDPEVLTLRKELETLRG